MNYKITTAGAIIAGLVIYILYLQQCKQQPKQKDKSPAVLSVDTQAILKKYQVVTHPKTDTVYRPGSVRYKPGAPGEPYPVPYEVVKEIPAKVDTQAIIQDYYSVRIKKDSFVTPEVGIRLTDSLYNNDIFGRQWDVQVTSKTVIKTVAPATIYFGGGFYNSKTILLSGAHVDLGYINRKGQHLKVDILRMSGEWHKGVTFYQPLWRFK
jgi:hypothetical protein